MNEELVRTLNKFEIRPTSPHHRLLTALWSMEWVGKNDLIEANNGQSDTPRRIRELRSFYGFDVAHVGMGDDSKYRLKSRETRLDEARRRKYYTIGQKKKLESLLGCRCAICGASFPSVEGNLQVDHRIPFDKMGETTLENGQFLCPPCNIMKRHICGLCEKDDCGNCPYAYPESITDRTIVSLPSRLLEKCDTKAAELGVTRDEVIRNAIENL